MTPAVFRGKTIDDAQHAARRALGDDAVILTTRRVRGGGLRGLFGGVDVEVAATVPPKLPKPQAAPPLPRGPFATSAYADEPPRPRHGDAVTSLRQEIRSMQGMMARAAAAPAPAAAANTTVEREIAALRDAIEKLADPSLPRTGAVGRVLRDTGLEGTAAAELVKAIKAAGGTPAPETIRDTIASMVRVAPWPLAEQRPSCIALVGPSGVGKTTTAAKLAGRAMHKMNKTVTLVTCDHVRVGAFEQMDRYADLLGAKIVASRSPGELQHGRWKTRTPTWSSWTRPAGVCCGLTVRSGRCKACPGPARAVRASCFCVCRRRCGPPMPCASPRTSRLHARRRSP